MHGVLMRSEELRKDKCIAVGKARNEGEKNKSYQYTLSDNEKGKKKFPKKSGHAKLTDK
jgi:hypothetical protein